MLVLAATPVKEISLETMISHKNQSNTKRFLHQTEAGRESPKISYGL